MRILVVTQYFWPEVFRINDFVTALGERGHEVFVLTGMPNYPSGRFLKGYGGWLPRREYFQGACVTRVPLLPRGRGGGVGIVLNYLSYAASASLIGPMLLPDDIDLMFVYEPSPVTVCLPAVRLKTRHGWPILFWIQDLWPESLVATGAVTSPVLLAAVGRLVRFLYTRSDRVLVQAEGFRARVVAQGADPKRVIYYPNWAEDFFRPMPPAMGSAAAREMPSGFRVVFTGNIGVSQDFPTLLTAAEHLRDRPDIQWIVFGDGRQREFVEAEITRRGLASSFHLMGFRPPDQLPAYLSLADALVVSLRRDPAFALTVPSKIQSYLASGRPIIGALDGEGAELIRKAGAGLVAPASDPRQLADCVRTLAGLPASERDAMGRRGHACYLEQFERTRLLDRLDGIMEEVLWEHRASTRALLKAA